MSTDEYDAMARDIKAFMDDTSPLLTWYVKESWEGIGSLSFFEVLAALRVKGGKLVANALLPGELWKDDADKGASFLKEIIGEILAWSVVEKLPPVDLIIVG